VLSHAVQDDEYRMQRQTFEDLLDGYLYEFIPHDPSASSIPRCVNIGLLHEHFNPDADVMR